MSVKKAPRGSALRSTKSLEPVSGKKKRKKLTDRRKARQQDAAPTQRKGKPRWKKERDEHPHTQHM